ncbi:hypothetical protein ARMGADRAFT_192091 [Armillaria gallica]|uniref:Uncharacterized protein n=1 Tax=Armillaria gallica TaxID=47427 RepID=A0A2H3DDL4_ARMGA|nr:hypothetical protein ARMGADRAFT_192091 [Armillaria gallica]
MWPMDFVIIQLILTRQLTTLEKYYSPQMVGHAILIVSQLMLYSTLRLLGNAVQRKISRSPTLRRIFQWKTHYLSREFSSRFPSESSSAPPSSLPSLTSSDFPEFNTSHRHPILLARARVLYVPTGFRAASTQLLS